MSGNRVTVKVESRIPKLIDAMRPNVRRVINRTLLNIRGRAVLAIMNPPKTGASYKVRGGRMHTASAPGEAPATDTGFLANSITVRMVNDLKGEVNVAAEYGAILEYGGARLAARPYLTPALEAESAVFQAAIRAILETK